MNEKIIGIIIAVLLIGAGAWYFTQNKNTSEVQNETATAETESELQIENASLKELMTRGRDTKCTWNNAEQQSSGTIYVSQGKGRADFSVTEDGQQKKGHMILASEMSYIWMDNEEKGFKIALNNTTQTDTSTSQGVNPDEKVDYSCGAWNADSSFFVPPANVDFQEFTMPAIPAPAAGANSQTQMQLDPTAICNSLSEPAKTQCLTSINKQ